MKRGYVILLSGIIAILFVFFAIKFVGNGVPEGEVLSEDASITTEAEVAVNIAPPEIEDRGAVNFEIYNYDFVDENVKGILNGMIGATGKTAFYLPPTGYIEVSRGTKYGVAYALNNPNPSGENYFEFNWEADSVQNCGVGVDEAQGWIERGWTSFGKIPEGWIDHMTVYFSFPSDIEPCSVGYNFEITKDGSFYDSKSIVFNLI